MIMASSNYGILKHLVTHIINCIIDFPCDGGRIDYELISDTDLFELIKNKTSALSCSFSNDGKLLAIYCRDRKIRLFDVKTGKLKKTINETLQMYIDE
jgi:peptidylprolyl isomerase domain and WD repeat-containing protein 1